MDYGRYSTAKKPFSAQATPLTAPDAPDAPGLRFLVRLASLLRRKVELPGLPGEPCFGFVAVRFNSLIWRGWPMCPIACSIRSPRLLQQLAVPHQICPGSSAVELSMILNLLSLGALLIEEIKTHLENWVKNCKYPGELMVSGAPMVD